MRVAALFVQDVGGCYSGLLAHLLNVDPWPASRDARRYDGPYPVVAHPPCQLWGPMAAVNWSRYGTHQIGYTDQRGADENKPTVGKHEASATPIAFRDELLDLARGSR